MVEEERAHVVTARLSRLILEVEPLKGVMVPQLVPFGSTLGLLLGSNQEGMKTAKNGAELQKLDWPEGRVSLLSKWATSCDPKVLPSGKV